MRVFNPRKLRYARILDAIGSRVFGLVRPRQRQDLAPLDRLAPRRILVIESHLIGDIVMAIPALRALRERFSNAHIVFVAGPWGRALLDGQGLVDAFVDVRFPWSTYDYSLRNLRDVAATLSRLRKEEWDLGIDFRGDLRNIVFLYLTKAKRRVSYDFTGGEYLLTDVVRDVPELRHIVEYNAHLIGAFGCGAVGKEPSLLVRDEERAEARSTLRDAGGLGERWTIGIHPGASLPLRHWRPDRFARLADWFLEHQQSRVILFRGPADHDQIAAITRLMRHTPVVIDQPLGRLPALFSNCDVLIGLDSGAVHIAAAVNVPTIVLFGPAEPERVQPVSVKSVVVIQDGYQCRPCDQVHCVQPGSNCMDALEVATVYDATMRALQSNAAAKQPIQK